MNDHQEWLRSFEHENHAKAAVEAVDDLGRLNGRARELLLPILTEAILMARRVATRRVERQIPVGAIYSGMSTLDERRTRLEQTFALPDGRRVSWSEATVADHEDRIAYLLRHVAGVQVTIGEHERAIETIREFGVSCLGEIGVPA